MTPAIQWTQPAIRLIANIALGITFATILAGSVSVSYTHLSTPDKVMDERIPDIKIAATSVARIRKSRLLPVFSAASATRIMPEIYTQPWRVTRYSIL